MRLPTFKLQCAIVDVANHISVSGRSKEPPRRWANASAYAQVRQLLRCLHRPSVKGDQKESVVHCFVFLKYGLDPIGSI